MSVCALHHYSPKWGKKPEYYGTCALCTNLWDRHLRRQRWKGAERRVAKVLGSRRMPGSGAYEGLKGDVIPQGGTIASFFRVIEVRSRKTWDVPGWIREVQEKAGTAPWLLVLTKPGYKNHYAVMNLSDLAAILGEKLAEEQNGGNGIPDR